MVGLGFRVWGLRFRMVQTSAYSRNLRVVFRGEWGVLLFLQRFLAFEGLMFFGKGLLRSFCWGGGGEGLESQQSRCFRGRCFLDLNIKHLSGWL